MRCCSWTVSTSSSRHDGRRSGSGSGKPARRRNLHGIERWQQLGHVTVKGVPQPDEIEALASLPALRHLSIHDPDTIPGLAHLRSLPALRQLDIDQVAQPGVEAVHVAVDDLGDVEVRINGRPVRRRRAA